ncbi:MAG: SsrA-binding protein SmpB [Deltaproteobacteria bacterium]|nr:SsrA-binding protein SmpB [Deltaproteobacteria bacterium]
MAKAGKADPGLKVVCRNRRARHDYQIEETMEAGMVLTGSEVKSLREGRADLVDSYATVRGGEIFLVGAHIAVYEKASRFGHAPTQERKLLLAKKAIERLSIKIRERGFTLVPLEIYFKNGWAKVLLGLAKGKKQYDHREAIRERDERRELARSRSDR